MISWGFIAWIVLGGLAGWVASKIMGTDKQQGLLLNIVVGVVGGLLGGWLLTQMGVDVAGGGLVFSFLTAVGGASLLLFIVGALSRRGSARS